MTTTSKKASATTRERVSFSKIPSAVEPPNLIEVQKQSFERFMTEGLAEAFAEASPIVNAAGTMEVTFGEHQFGDPSHTTYRLWSAWSTTPTCAQPGCLFRHCISRQP